MIGALRQSGDSVSELKPGQRVAPVSCPLHDHRSTTPSPLRGVPMNKPWLKFYPRDWRADPRLRMCSLAARGLWAELLGYMHEAEPYGHLLVDGKKPEHGDLAALVGRPLTETRKAMTELGERGVYSTTADGVIYSRRMVRDNERSEEGRGHIKKRWPNRGDDRAPNSPPNRSDDRGAGTEPITQRPESRKKEDAADAAPDSLEKQLFDRGKQICGTAAGGLIAKLLKAKKGDVALARSALELAATKQNPREFIGAIISGGHASPDGRRLTNDEQYWGVGRIPGIV